MLHLGLEFRYEEIQLHNMAVLKEMYSLSCHSDTYKNTFLGLLVGQLISTCFPGFANLKSRNAKYELLIVRFYIYRVFHNFRA